MIKFTIQIGKNIKERFTKKVALYLGIIASLITIVTFLITII